MNKSKNLLKGIIGLVIMFSVAKMVVVSLVATNGIEINQLEKQTNSIKQENKSLSEEISRLSSIRRVVDEAMKLGFTNNSPVVSLSQAAPLALR